MSRATCCSTVLVAGVLAASLAAQTPNEAGMLSTTLGGGFVSVPDSPSLVPSTGSVTVEAWFYYTGGGGLVTILRKPSGYPAYLLRLQSPTNVNVYINVNGSYVSISASVPNVTNSWHHLAGTYDGLVVKLYFDGVLVASQPAPGTLTNQSGPLQIGQGANTSEQWPGSLDEVRLWSVARTQAQIQADRTYELGPTPGLVSVWRMNGNLQDSIGSNHGSAVGAITLPLSTSPVFGTYLIAPTTASIGSTLVFDLVAADAGLPYLFDISLTGTAPGIPLGPPIGVTIPLNPPLVNFDLGPVLPPGMLTNFLGIVPMTHHASPMLQLPGIPSLVGLTLSSTFLVMDPASPALIKKVAAPRTTTIATFAPNITSVTPPTSPQSGGAVITIGGTNFQPGASVFVDGAPATNVIVTPASITATTPAGALGPADVSVVNPDLLSDVAPGALTYVADLVLTSIAPLNATAGAAGTITGSGFVNGLAVSAGALAITPLTVTPTTISFVVPAGIPCNTIVTVVNPDLQTKTITWNPSPVVSQGINLQGSAAGGGSFFLLGAFTPGTTVTVGGVPATVTASSGIAVLGVAPPGMPGPAPIVAASASGCATAAGTYVYQ